MLRVPGPISRRTEVAIPPGTEVPPEWRGKIAVHNDPDTDPRKAWPWESLERLAAEVGPERIALLGQQGPPLPGVLDLRGRTTLAQAAAVIRESRCYVGVDSGLMWIAGSLQVPTVGLYGTSYIAAYEAIQPVNPQARYLQIEGPVSGIPVEAVLAALEDCLQSS